MYIINYNLIFIFRKLISWKKNFLLREEQHY